MNCLGRSSSGFGLAGVVHHLVWPVWLMVWVWPMWFIVWCGQCGPWFGLVGVVPGLVAAVVHGLVWPVWFIVWFGQCGS